MISLPEMPRLLQKLEQYAQTDLRYVVRGGTWLTLSNLANSLTAFFSSIAFAYFVPKDTFGMYQYVLAVVGILTIATLPKVNDAVSRAVSRGSEAEFYKGLQLRLRWGAFASLGSVGVAGYYALVHNLPLAGAFCITALFVWFFDAEGMYITYLKAKRLFREATYYKAAARIIALGAMVLVIWYTQNLLLILFAYFAIQSSLRMISHTVVTRQYPPNTQEDPETLPYGKQLSLLATFKTVVLQFDKLLVFHYLGATELAVYFFVTAPVDQVRAVLSALADLASPKFSKTAGTVLRATLLPKIIRLELAVVLPITAGYILLIPYVFPLVFPAYAAHVPFTQLYALSLIFFPALLLSTALVAQKRKRELWVSRLLNPLVRLMILIPAVHWWGLSGIIAGVVVASGADFCINLGAFLWARVEEKGEDAPVHS
jgi:O-antigen/teichoic acid export membrane protein